MSATKLNRGTFLTGKTLTIPAGRSIDCHVSGSGFRCTESTAKFLMGFDDGEQFPMEVGLGFDMASGDGFAKLTFKNDTAADIVISFYAGYVNLVDARLNTLIERLVAVFQKLYPTRLIPTTTTAIAAGDTLTVLGVNAGCQRKQIVVTNLDANLDLQICSSTGVDGATVFPRTAWTLETNATVKIKNPGAQLVNVQVLEAYYTA